ncbi:pyridine nucleotide-disulfide oxidoreductase [Nocardioides psychrotolerans]|uniref:Reductase C-terminal n=1 Tax=Nocardioides psychrotolerans TaxID=1005945 RepID=A0A1I3ET13_9ACTN|nr:FAD-dependent oxidoreductase [Nocardioides psychrotolerans]GEP39153.1 pyridine nucleotide-disulfide oxidoreductase [Nocardioides psychrotolerans]SFI02105.1 Reductase C-terminal [Nocardioides psychrotolerans]
MAAPRRLLVVGASLAGHAAARALRGAGFDGDVVMIGDERHRPYDRPPLSKGFLAGTTSVEDLSLEDHDGDLGLDWRLGVRAVALDPGTRTVTLADGDTLTGDAVVIATGSRARTLPPGLGGEQRGVHTLRTLDDAVALRAELLPGARLVLVGAGFVGAEIAATARTLGLDVTLVEAAAGPLAGPLGSEVGAMVARLHAAHGVPLLCGTPVARLTGRTRVEGVELADGRHLPADVVVVGIGSVASVDWLAGSGLDLAGPTGGLGCDAVGFTGAPGVYGVGDCSAWHDAVCGAQHRVEHWTDSHERPRRAVDALLAGAGAGVAAPLPAPYFWSEQYGVHIQFAGHRFGDETVTIEAGSPETCDVLAVYRRGGKATAVLGMNQPRLFGRLRRSLVALPVAV